MSAFVFIDHLLRNRELVSSDLRDPTKVNTCIVSSLITFISLSFIYGLVMGANNIIHGGRDAWLYLFGCAVKTPLLFLATLIICIPLLYVLNVLIGTKDSFKTIAGYILSSLAVTSIFLAACAPIVGFFMLSTKSYFFIKFLHVLVFFIAGLYGVWYLGKTMIPKVPPYILPDGRAIPQKNPAGKVMNWWLFTYGIVGAQMSWIMRPFVGYPDMPYSFFRPFQSNFFENVLITIGKIFGM